MILVLVKLTGLYSMCSHTVKNSRYKRQALRVSFLPYPSTPGCSNQGYSLWQVLSPFSWLTLKVSFTIGNKHTSVRVFCFFLNLSFSLLCYFYFLLFLFWDGLTVQLRMAWNLLCIRWWLSTLSSCVYLLSARITDTYHHALLYCRTFIMTLYMLMSGHANPCS